MPPAPELSERQRRIFAAAMEAMVGRAPGKQVPAAAERLIRRLAPADRRLLPLLLLILEYGAPAFTGRPRRFTRLSLERRQAYLNGWLESRIPLRRQAVSALKAVAMLAHYGSDESWPEVGYDGPWLGRMPVAVLPAPELGAGITLGRTRRADLELRAEVCVIGTGAGGAAALARSAELGMAVVGVEAGGCATAADFNQRELDMLPLLYQEAGLRATADKAIGILQGRGIGGSTLHNTGLVYPPPTGIVQRWREEHGFPLDRPTLDRYVAAAMDTLHARPIPAERINRNNGVLREGAQALGWRFRIALHNREECCGCGYCMLGCAYNRKYNAALTYVPRATAAGARILADAAVRHIEGPSGARRVVCDLMDGTGRPTGHRATIEAPVVLIAAGALDSPALLLRSGMAGRCVGRGLRLHPSALVAGIFPQPIEAWRGLPQAVIIEELATFTTTGRGGSIVIPIAGWPGLTAALVPGIGGPHRAVMREYRNLASAAVLLHDETAGRVSLGRDGRPVARYWPDAADRAELVRAIRALARLYLAAGASRVQLPFGDTPPVHAEDELDDALARARLVPHRFSLNSVHPQGSCPLGERRDRSAVDPHREVWGERGVFVCDTSVFPTSVGVPPQVTTMALAAATADYASAERL